MAEDDVLRRDLLWRIEARRASIQAYLRDHRPRTRRRATITVVLSSLAALFTAGPALGGEPFAASIASAVLVNLGKANDEVARLSSADAANTELEGLTGLMQFGRVSVDDGAKLYQQYIVKIPLVDDVPTGPAGAPACWPGQYAPPQPGAGQYAPPPPGS